MLEPPPQPPLPSPWMLPLLLPLSVPPLFGRSTILGFLYLSSCKRWPGSLADESSGLPLEMPQPPSQEPPSVDSCQDVHVPVQQRSG